VAALFMTSSIEKCAERKEENMKVKKICSSGRAASASEKLASSGSL